MMVDSTKVVEAIKKMIDLEIQILITMEDLIIRMDLVIGQDRAIVVAIRIINMTDKKIIIQTREDILIQIRS